LSTPKMVPDFPGLNNGYFKLPFDDLVELEIGDEYDS